MLNVRITMEGETLVDRDLQGLESRILAPFADPATVRATVEQFRAIVAAAFATEGGSTPQAWRELADATKADRVRQHFGAEHPILERTGTLRRSLTTDQGLGFTETSATSLVIGTNDPKFKYHQSNKARRRLPRRAPVLLTAQNKTAIIHPLRLSVTGREPNSPRRARPYT